MTVGAAKSGDCHAGDNCIGAFGAGYDDVAYDADYVAAYEEPAAAEEISVCSAGQLLIW